MTISLLVDDVPKQTLKLTADNEWTASFTDLNKNHTDGSEIIYTVKEESVPEGYISSVTKVTETDFVVTNTQKLPTEPMKPDKPTKQPDMPDDPAKPGTPDHPSTPDHPGTPDHPSALDQPVRPDESTPSDKPDNTPTTGDASHIELWISLSLIFLCGAIVLLLANLKKRRIS